jgi:SAM-dependent methyltransferase
MEQGKDAFGQEMLAFYEGRDSFEIIEREDGYVAISGGSANYLAEHKDWPECQKQGIRFAKGKVLDIGCGAGRVGIYLERKGLEVLGIDNSPLAVKVSKMRGAKAMVRSIEEVSKFKKDSFDTVVMYGNNFGLFGNFRKAKKLLKDLHKVTSPNALIMAESNDPYKTDDPAHLNYQAQNRRKGKMSGQLRLRTRFKMYIGDWFEYLLVSQKEMEEILKDTGWKIKKFIGSEGSAYVAIIEKV